MNAITKSSDYKNLNHIADTYVALKATIEAQQKELEHLRDQIIGLGLEEVVGFSFTLTVKTAPRTTLDTKLARTFLTDAEISACEKTSEVTTLRVKPSLNLAA
jgi:hypothetical protein